MNRHLFFDAHLDLGALAVNGRDLTAPLEKLTPEGPHRAGPWPPPAVTIPSLLSANCRFVLGTIFTETDGADAEGYPANNPDAAHAKGRAQLEAYHTWRDQGLLKLDLLSILRDDPHVGDIRGGMGVAEPTPFDTQRKLAPAIRDNALHAAILMENADPIRDPEELPFWVERGVAVISLAWWKPSRYAQGNGAPPGDTAALTDLGRALVDAMDHLHVVHDQSHLSDASTRELLDRTDRPVIASHSNCRALLGGDDNPAHQRHLPDEFIREIGARQGVIGLNLVRNFIRWPLDPHERPAISEAADHVEHICSLLGSRDHVGLGTDMDGGISANDLPNGIDKPAHLTRICEELANRGWSDDQLARFTHLNWLDFFRRVANQRRRQSP